MKSTNERLLRNAIVWPGVVSLILWAAALGIAGTTFVLASQNAREAADGALIPMRFLGLPLFEGFHDDGRFGVHPEFGLLVLLIVPAVVGIVVAVVGVWRSRGHD